MFNFCAPEQTPESYSAKLRELLPSISSVILYGSAATGDFLAKKSDYNLLVIGQQWGVLELNQVARVSQEWLKAGNPPPLFFTLERLKASADCFPIEMIDMKQSYRVIYGEDVLKDLVVETSNLRLMTERELKSLKIQLRQSFIYAEGKPDKVMELLVSTLSTTLVLFRAALRLYAKEVPAKKYEVLQALKVFVKEVDEEAFLNVRNVKNGELKPSAANAMALFDKVLASIVAVSDAVDKLDDK
jgi:predicted nucleotidyltransferase